MTSPPTTPAREVPDVDGLTTTEAAIAYARAGTCTAPGAPLPGAWCYRPRNFTL